MSEQLKIVFLDIDGVLNHIDHYMRDNYNEILNWPFNQFCPDSIYLLNKITDKTGAKIVVSSSWRQGKTVDELKELFKEVKITGEVIDKTCSMIGVKGYSIPRGCEIEHWLKAHKFQRINFSLEKQKEYAEKSEIFNYIILDDDSDMLYNQREHFIKTSRQCGLSDSDVDTAINILSKPIWEVYYNNQTNQAEI